MNNFERHSIQENQDQAHIEFSELYREPWRNDKKLKQLYETHMYQIKDQVMQVHRTRSYLHYLNDHQRSLVDNMES